MKKTAAEIQEYRDLLKARYLTPGKRVYVKVNHWTPNGTRYLDVYVVQAPDGTDDVYSAMHIERGARIERITAFAAWATGYTYDSRREAIRTQNSELDIVRSLGRNLYGDELALNGERLS